MTGTATDDVYPTESTGYGEGMTCTVVDDAYSTVRHSASSETACTAWEKGGAPQRTTRLKHPSFFVCRSSIMSSNGSDSDGAHPRAHEAVDRKIKYTLDTFECINVDEHNVEFKFKDGAVKLSYDEALTEGTKSAKRSSSGSPRHTQQTPNGRDWRIVSTSRQCSPWLWLCRC